MAHSGRQSLRTRAFRGRVPEREFEKCFTALPSGYGERNRGATDMRRAMKRGFTIVELLVVIAIIALLVAILLPAINRARESARNLQCKNRLKQVATAANSYEGLRDGYPPHAGLIGKPVTRSVSWLVFILPQLDENKLYDAWKTLKDAELPRPFLPVLSCPSDGTAINSKPSMSYMANAGRKKDFEGKYKHYDLRDYGVFLPWAAWDSISRTSLDFIHERGDGASKTLLLAENIQLQLIDGRLGSRWDLPYSKSISTSFGDLAFTGLYANTIVWHATTDLTPVMRVNGNRTQRRLSAETARPASYHPGAANVAFCDGRVAFLRDDISYRVYIQLMVPRDAAIEEVDPEFAKRLGPLRPLSENDY